MNEILKTTLKVGEVVPRPGNFDPNFDVPTTDEHVKYALSVRPDTLGPSMWGIYVCTRRQGHSILKCWEDVLWMALGKKPPG